MKNQILETNLTNTSKPLLDEEKTTYFIKELEEALNVGDFSRIYCLIGDMGLETFSIETEFHRVNEYYNHFYWDNSRVEKVEKIEPFETNCFKCDFGKKIFAIRITYLNDEKCIKTGEIAIKFDIEDNQLMHFKYCKHFLKFDEVKQLLRKIEN